MIDNIRDNIIEQIKNARIEALRRGIETNIVMISNDIGIVENLTIVEHNLNGVTVEQLPTLIMGMKCVYTNELPKNAAFALAYNVNCKDLEQENEQLKHYIKMLKGTIKGLQRKVNNNDKQKEN